MAIWKEYIPCEGENMFLKCELDYSLGGYNVFSYKEEPRGYYLSVSPVERVKRDYGVVLESYTAFSGIKKCLVEVKRKSQKKEAEAVSMVEEHKAELIESVLIKNGMKIA